MGLQGAGRPLSTQAHTHAYRPHPELFFYHPQQTLFPLNNVPILCPPHQPLAMTIFSVSMILPILGKPPLSRIM